jgi:hypothetical protein
MLQIETPFPNPGSIAMLDGARVRVLQLMPGGSAFVSPLDGIGHTRRCAKADLVDAAEADRNAVLPFTDREEADKRRALWIARHLRDANMVALSDLHAAMFNAAAAGAVPACHDRRHLSALLRKLGWAKTGISDFGVSIYARIVTPTAQGCAA